eukprot:1153229-Pelagomonas_calceolata.AAC.7
MPTGFEFQKRLLDFLDERPVVRQSMRVLATSLLSKQQMDGIQPCKQLGLSQLTPRNLHFRLCNSIAERMRGSNNTD